MRFFLLIVLIVGLSSLGGYLVLERRAQQQDTMLGAISDPVVGYRAGPRKKAGRFSTNGVSMRAAPVPDQDDHCTLRIMILGDSVVFAEDLPDDDLATSRLEKALSDALDWPVWVGNASMGGWSANNIRGYIERFGWFEADMIGFVLNSHDIDQSNAVDPAVVEGEPIALPGLSLPERAWNWLARHTPFAPDGPAIAVDPYVRENGAPPAKDVLRRLFVDAQQLGPTFIFHNRVVGEIERHDEVSARALRDRERAERLVSLIREHGVAYTDLGSMMAEKAGTYSDEIHLTASGQGIMAEAMLVAMKAPASALIDARPGSCHQKETTQR